MGREEHGDRDIVQSGTRHTIRCFEDRIEIVRVPIISDEGVDREPDVGLGRVPFRQRSVCIRRIKKCRWGENGLENAWEGEN